jgi:zinc transporter ZupT
MITPCSKCHKRHGRNHDSDGSSGTSIKKPAASQSARRALMLMASLLAAASASPQLEAPLGVGPANANKRSLAVTEHEIFAMDAEREGGERRIQTVEDTDHGHEGDHEDEIELHIFEAHDEDHTEEGEVHAEEGEHGEDEHEDHDEGEEHGDHDEEEHEGNHEGETEDEHDHDGHDHEKEDHDELHSTEFSEINNQEATSSKPWGAVIGATLLVNCAALTGLLLMVLPVMRRGMLTSTSDSKSHGKLIDIIIPSFAVGALMATTVFLVVPEALHLIEGAHASHEEGEVDDHDGHNHRFLQEEEGNAEGVTAAKLGCGILGGFLLPVFLSIFFHRDDEVEEEDSALPVDEEECRSCMEEKDVESGAVPQDRGDVISTAVVIQSNDSASVHDADESVNGSKEEVQGPPIEPIAVKTKTFINYRLGASILIGDAFHNFADGLFIGAAFLGCSWATAMSITAVSLFHELAQELADFILLTRYVGLSVFQACSLNFASGLSVCLGGITILAAKPSDEAIGIILAFAGGVYTNIAACESMPRVESSIKDRSDRALTFFSIILGAVPIGLILLDHKHC